jgi:hypothetical protein
MTPDETLVLDLDVDRPAFSDQGDQVVAPPTQTATEIDRMTDRELLAEAGVKLFYSTSETAEFFDRSNQWLYWGLREGVFTDDDGNPLSPDRIGDADKGRRRFTVPLIRQIMRSSYRRGNLDPEQLKVIMRRIRLTEEGIEWREREGWRYAHLGRNRWRWIRPEEAFFHQASHEWRPRPKSRKKKASPKADA